MRNNLRYVYVFSTVDFNFTGGRLAKVNIVILANPFKVTPSPNQNKSYHYKNRPEKVRVSNHFRHKTSIRASILICIIINIVSGMEFVGDQPVINGYLCL